MVARIRSGRSVAENGVRMIGGVTEAPPKKADLPRNADLAAQFDLLADLMELEGADAFRIAAYRRAATRIHETGSSVAQLALDGRAKELQGIGKTIEQKIVEVVEDGEIHALTKRKAEVPEEVASFMRLPGLGPEDGAAALAGARDHDRRRPARGRRGAAAPRSRRARARSRRRRSSPRSPSLAPPRGRGARCSASTLPKLRAVADDGRGPSGGASGSRSPARPGAIRETVRDLDLIATATDAPALLDAFCSLPWVVEVAAKGPTKATVVGQDGLRFDLRVVPPECLRQPAPALHRLEGPQRRAARGGRPARALGLRVRDHRGRERRGARVRDRGGGVRLPRLRVDPARAARERRRARRGPRAASCPTLVELGDLRGDLHTHTTWSDGKDTLEAMVAARGREGLRLLRDLRPLAPAARRAARAAGGGDRRARTSACRSRSSRGSRSTSAPAASSTSPTSELATLDWVVASVHYELRQGPDRARAGGDGEPVRRLHRPPDRPQDRPARAVRRSTSSA